MNTELQKVADYINTSTTGAIATLRADHVTVQVPGLQSLPKGKTALFYSIEHVRNLPAAIRLVGAMQ